jgi:hypothetical protein
MVRRPFQKFDVRNELRLEPAAFVHVLGRQAFAPSEGKIRNGILSTLSSRGEVMGTGPERPELIWPEDRRCVPVVIAD